MMFLSVCVWSLLMAPSHLSVWGMSQVQEMVEGNLDIIGHLHSFNQLFESTETMRGMVIHRKFKFILKEKDITRKEDI